ncbi:MAG: PaaI family thioesterase [Candidatus Dadabacteria bacterium]|nr:MAG: PaaI family thioesterase [Candidatus Dadabacteria bacterium]
MHVTDLVAAIPYARFLGVRVERTPAGLLCVLPFRRELVGNPNLPALHGGVLGAFLELTAILQLIEAEESARVARPINFGIDYLRTARPRETRARAEIVKLGRRVANVRAVAWQDDPDRPVAAGNGKFLL